MLKGRFGLESVVTVERTDDANDISYKWEDLTSKSIRSLIDHGYEDGNRALK
jgi:hypothetical protein